MTTTSATEAIALLINLAQAGEIDPWDVQVIEVIDRFLDELAVKGATTEDQADLPQSGQAFLWASMLVLLKAKTLERLELEQEEEVAVVESEEDLEPQGHSRKVALETHLRRRSAAPPLRKRRVTLTELIEQIEQIAAEVEKASPGQRQSRPRSQSRREAVQTIAALAHNENLTEIATELEQFLQLCLPQVASQPNSIELEDLLDGWAKSQHSQNLSSPPQSQTSRDRVGIFWALLLLSSQSKVELEQTEFYQDLKIKPFSGHLQNNRSH